MREADDGDPPARASAALRATVALATVLASALGASSCARERCPDEFALSASASAPGSATPAAAVHDWVRGFNSHPGRAAPMTGWEETGASSSSLRHVSHGGWELEVTAVPAGGWAVTAGTTC